VKRLTVIAFFCLISATALLPQSGDGRQTSGFDEEHTKWIANAMRSIEAIQVGMTRRDLMKIFTTEGGLEFKDETTSRRTYVYRKCPYIKVDVTLAIANPAVDLPTDTITTISRPYLQWTVTD
jgi:hypothetical protein